MNLGNGYTYVGNNPWTYVDPMGLGVDVIDTPTSDGKINRHYYDTGGLFRARDHIGTYKFDPKDGESVQRANDLLRTQNFQAVVRDASGVAKTTMETAIRINPASDVIEAATGKDIISGERLGLGDRAVSTLGPVLGVLDDLNDARKVANTINKLDDGCDAARTSCKVDRAGKNASVKLVPQKATDTLIHVRKTGKPPQGYTGGRVFQNREGKLPQGGKYREYDVDPTPPKGQSRNSERIVVDETSGRTWYTDDHYSTFQEIK